MNALQFTPIDSAKLPRFQSGRASAATSLLNAISADSIKWNSDQLDQIRLVSIPVDDSEVVFDRLVALKLATADFVAHLGEAWRAGLFKRLDDLLDADEWVFSDEMPSIGSFKTLLRMIIHNGVQKRPSLGATHDGRIIASWRGGDDRLVVESFPNDEVRWVASCTIDGKRVSAAGTSPVSFLRTALTPYHPEVWFG